MPNDIGQAQYGTDGSASAIGTQFNVDFYHKKALIEAQKEQYFSQLADVTAMPKHFGKKIKLYHYMPLLDDRNVNDQGIDAAGADIADGTVSLYGSSKDIGAITSKLPLLSETGGRVNRVGYSRINVEASLEKLGFFDEYTQESLDFDTDEMLYEHMSREMIMGANEITEDVLQIDLLNGAGVIRYGGDATTNATVTGEGATPSIITYSDLQRMSIDLDANRTPKRTKIITGSRMVDTKVVNSGRFLYVGSEMVPTLSKMKDHFDNPAFIGVEQYAHSASVTGADLINGEIGKVDQFRIIQVPEMAHWSGVGADETVGNLGYRATGSKYDVFPMLCIGAESFTTVGFQTDGKSVKFKIKHSKPGSDTSYSQTDPFGETGFSSIKWFYATMILRPERIALAKSVAEI